MWQLIFPKENQEIDMRSLGVQAALDHKTGSNITGTWNGNWAQQHCDIMLDGLFLKYL